MARFVYDRAAAGVRAGAVKHLPDALALSLARKGYGHIAEETPKKPVSAPSKDKAVKVPAKTAKARKTGAK